MGILHHMNGDRTIFLTPWAKAVPLFLLTASTQNCIWTHPLFYIHCQQKINSLNSISFYYPLLWEFLPSHRHTVDHRFMILAHWPSLTPKMPDHQTLWSCYKCNREGQRIYTLNCTFHPASEFLMKPSYIFLK